jgi:RuvA, C-terminal domain
MTFNRLLAVAHLGCVAALMFASFDGLQAYFVPTLGLVVGALLAIGLVVGVDGGLAASLREWRLTGSLGMFVLMLVFLVISWSITLPFWFRVLRGEAVVVTAFEQQRNDIVRDIMTARGTLSSVVDQAHALNTHSAQLATDEYNKGFTCENIGHGEGPRRRFRNTDASRFADVERSVTAVRDRLNTAAASLERLPSIVRTDPATVLRLTNDAVAGAYAAMHDPVLHSISLSLRERSRVDGDVRTEPGSNEKFRCPDRQIAGGSVLMADSLDALPAFNTRVVVPDVRDARTAFVELPGRILRTLRGEKNGLEPEDNSALAFGALAELLVLASALFTYRRRPGRWLRQVAAAEEFSGSDALKFFAALAKAPDPEIESIVRAFERYRLRFGRINLIVVSHGCTDPLVRRLAWALPILSALHMARRDRWLPERFLDLLAYFRWPETRGSFRREAYHFNLGMLDELQLAELIKKMNEAPLHPAPPIAPGADAAQGRDTEPPPKGDDPADHTAPAPQAPPTVPADEPTSDASDPPGPEAPQDTSRTEEDAISALKNLGVRRSQAEDAVSAAQVAVGANADLDTVIREALKYLGRERRLLPPPEEPRQSL